MNCEPKTILIANEYTIFREALLLLIQEWNDFRVVGEVDNGQAALEFCQKILPDIVLMDVNMPIMGGIEATWHITEKFPSVKVIMLTMSGETQNLFLAVKAGACGYVLKNTNAQQLHFLLTSLDNNKEVLTDYLAEHVLSEDQYFRETAIYLRPEEDRNNEFSERETEIIRLLTYGLTNAEIGERLFLSEDTIKKYLKDVMQKLNLNNRVQVAVYALQNGLTRQLIKTNL